MIFNTLLRYPAPATRFDKMIKYNGGCHVADSDD